MKLGIFLNRCTKGIRKTNGIASLNCYGEALVKKRALPQQDGLDPRSSNKDKPLSQIGPNVSNPSGTKQRVDAKAVYFVILLLLPINIVIIIIILTISNKIAGEQSEPFNCSIISVRQYHIRCI